MLIVMSVCGFLGAWCLFVGPVYQASLELRALELERERMVTLAKNAKRTAKTSAWWWLVPPVKWYLERRRSRTFRDEYFKSLSVEDLEALFAYMHKATGWLLVAGGGFLLAVKETFAFCKDRHASMLVFALLSIAGTAFGLAWTAFRMHGGDRRIAALRPDA